MTSGNEDTVTLFTTEFPSPSFSSSPAIIPNPPFKEASAFADNFSSVFATTPPKSVTIFLPVKVWGRVTPERVVVVERFLNAVTCSSDLDRSPADSVGAAAVPADTELVVCEGMSARNF